MNNCYNNNDLNYLEYNEFQLATDADQFHTESNFTFDYYSANDEIHTNQMVYKHSNQPSSSIPTTNNTLASHDSQTHYGRISYTNSTDVNYYPQQWLIIDPISRRSRPPRQNEFLYLLLEDPRYLSYLSWIDKDEGLFKIHDPEHVASLWSKVKHRKTPGPMNYDKFARALRFYYQTGSMIKTHRKHTFRFKVPLRKLF